MAGLRRFEQRGNQEEPEQEHGAAHEAAGAGEHGPDELARGGS